MTWWCEPIKTEVKQIGEIIMGDFIEPFIPPMLDDNERIYTMTPTKQTHTPTPWKVAGDGTLIQYKIQGMQRWQIRDVGSTTGESKEEAEANARHIVHCVNNYPALVEALKECKNTFELMKYKNQLHISEALHNQIDQALAEE